MIKQLLKFLGYQPIPRNADTEDESDGSWSGFFTTDLGRSRKKSVEPDDILALSIRQDAVQAGGIATIAQDSAAGLAGGIKGRFNGGFGTMPELQAMWYASQGFIGYQMAAILAQHWLIDKACTIVGEDAVRNGWEVTFSDEVPNKAEVVKAFEAADKKFQIRFNLEQFSRFNRVFGVRLAIMDIESSDPAYYEKPFNPDGITPGSYKGISQVDPYWVMPELDGDAAANPASRHFYVPTFYRISGKRYHRTHLVIIRNGEVADVLKPTYLYGGIPLPQKIYERVYASERTANEAPQLLLTKRTNAIHTDVEKALMNPAKFQERMEHWADMRDNYGVKVLGKDETMEQFDTTLTDFDVTVMTQYQLVAAIADVPATKLLGTSPKGFNATGEFEDRSYHETLKSEQTHFLQPLLERHHLCLMRSAIAPELLGGVPIETGIKWESTDEATAKEIAEMNKLKAETGTALVNSGAIDGADERARISADPLSGYNGLAELPEYDDVIDQEETAVGGQPEGTDAQGDDLNPERVPSGEVQPAAAKTN